MKRFNTTPNAFTMIELVFVIVILGIVSSIGAEIISQVYESYIVQRAQYKATTKTELALNEIANRLRYAIPGTVGFRNTISSSIFKSITETNAGNDKVLQWVAYDGDSFEAISSSTSTGAARRPGWSGVCDINASSSSSIVTLGSKLSLANTIIGNLSGSTKNLADAILYFPDGSDYNVSGRNGENNITLVSPGIPNGSSIYERYKLAWSSYALSVESGDLYLYYNFSPIAGATPNSSYRSLLLKNVTNFRFKGTEGSIRIKICKVEKIGAEADANVTSCKEKVVF